MATQSQLLNLAKQGNPQAIAALMNLVLEPKGVTTIAQLADDCLLIMVQSEKPLNQAAIVNFIRSGIGALGATSIRKVKVSAQKAEGLPLWREEFQLEVPLIEPIPTSDLASSRVLKSHLHRPTPSASSWVQRLIQQSSSVATRFLPRAGLTRPKVPSAIHLSMPISMPMPTIVQQLLLQITPSNQWMVLGGMAAIAFTSGGIVAAVTNAAISPQPLTTRAASTQQSFPAAMVPAVSNPHTAQSLTDLTIAVQQNEVKGYLTKMTQAQQAFYQTNGRFASSVAVLEQASIPKSAYYAYKLMVIDQTQARLTAVPKTEKLKSYVSAVLANANAAEMKTILCESAQPSTLAPTAPEVSGDAIACEAGSTNVTK